MIEHRDIYKKIDEMKPSLEDIALKLWNNPELGYFEFESAKTLIELLEENGFCTERPVVDLDTAFVSTYDSGKPGRTVAFVAEYDALPEIGHACGHNLFSVAACASAIALKGAVDLFGGKLKVIGTPCEEGTHPNAGGKVIMVKEGVFNDVDIAMICHGDDRTYVKRYLVASTGMTVDFEGTSIHAGGDVTHGKNALTAANLVISNINAIRQHFFERAVVNPVITNGGAIPNTLPKETQLKLTIRSVRKDQLVELIGRVENCVKAAALVTGCEYRISKQKNIYEDIRPNDVLAKLFSDSLDEQGVPYTEENSANFAWDIGNVSYVVPTIAPYIKIGESGILCHSTEFLKASRSDSGFVGLVIAAKAMAATAMDYMASPDVQIRVREEYENML